MIRFWVVRVSGGEFSDACRKGNYVAIGWNALGDLRWLLNEKDEHDAKRRLFEMYSKTARAKNWHESDAARRTNSAQIYRFVKVMKNEDILLSPTARRTVLIGKITSDYYPSLKKKDSCDYKQRRDVSWIKEISRDDMSQALQHSLGAHLTVFNVDSHKQELTALTAGAKIATKPDKRYPEKTGEESIVGEAINFRGLIYAPINEQGVVFLFSKVSKDLNIEIEEIKTGFPDAIGRVKTTKGYARRKIEFEFKSSDFKNHGHPVQDCDIIVCWENDWADCPEKIEILELQSVVKELSGRQTTTPS